MVVEEGEEIQTKDIDNLLNRKLQKTSLTLRKRESPRCRKFTEHKSDRTKKRSTPRHIIKTLRNRTKNSESSKREKKSHI
jgi:hypothetical protein